MLILNKKKWFKKKLDDLNDLACESISNVGTARFIFEFDSNKDDNGRVSVTRQTYDYILDWLKQSNKDHKEMIEIIQNLKGEL